MISHRARGERQRRYVAGDFLTPSTCILRVITIRRARRYVVEAIPLACSGADASGSFFLGERACCAAGYAQVTRRAA